MNQKQSRRSMARMFFPLGGVAMTAVWLAGTAGAFAPEPAAQAAQAPRQAGSLPAGVRVGHGGNSWYSEDSEPLCKAAGITGHRKIRRTSPVGLKVENGFDAEQNKILQNLAWDVVSKSPYAGVAPLHAAPPKPTTGSYLPLLRSHYDRVIAHGTDTYGADKSGLWLASVDIMHGGQPEKKEPAVKRTYREIHAPRGSNLYWDQPYVVAAYNLSRLSGEHRYKEAAESYLRAFLARCVSKKNGLFLWGNHLYYDVFSDVVVAFSGGHFEARPLPCAWDMFWAIAPQETERCIRSMAIQHVKDPQTGLYDRHASIKEIDPPKGRAGGVHPFLESGGVLVESMCWLWARTGRSDSWLRDRAMLVARFNFHQRGKQTGLVQNQPGPVKRWDYYASTTEVGLWAGCLLRSASYTGADEFRTMARDAVAAYLRYGYDTKTGRYFGQLTVADGSPRRPERKSGAGEDTIYQPGEYADLWEPLFPTHNYPMCMAEACLTLYQQTHDEQFKQAAVRFAKMITLSVPANAGKGACADQYGRCIHFLVRAADILKDEKLRSDARRLADEALGHLYCASAGMFRSHPGEDRCDAVDGLGILFLSLIYLETGAEPHMLGFGW